MPAFITEDEVEQSALDIFRDMGYEVLFGPDISEGGLHEERKYTEVVLAERLRQAIASINPDVPEDAREQALKKVLRAETQNLVENNHIFHRYVTDGVDIEYRDLTGTIKHGKVWLFDYEHPENNEFLAVNQYTVKEERSTRRPDIVLFINGLPVAVFELKNPGDEAADLQRAYNQLQTYKTEIPALLRYTEILVISDGLISRTGTITAPYERFMAWKTINGEKQESLNSLELLTRGMFAKKTLLNLIGHYLVFENPTYDATPPDEDAPRELQKKLAAYHQYNAVEASIGSTLKAQKGDHRAGIVWHTQGSGKSLTMVFYAGKVILEPQLENPTLVVITDRNDLDDQLYATFSRCREILRQTPKQAENCKHLQELLQVSSGGVIFTTLQKFNPDEDREKYPRLSERSNIIVIADEAHRSHYGFKAKVTTKKREDDIETAHVRYGFAKYLRDALPNASFIGFTGTPIEKEDRSTPAVFGNYTDVYDIQQSIEDNVTVRIYYESRLIKIDLKPEEIPHIDSNFDEATEGDELEHREQLKTKWAALEKIMSSPATIEKMAADIIDHYEKRESVQEGKAMVVAMSRRICCLLYDEITRLRFDWHNDDPLKGKIKVIITGSASDEELISRHVYNKKTRRTIGDQFKDPHSEPEIVIVRDMWLTGFDVPCLHTMYIGKPMVGHNLMQAIARVNRVFKEKEGGLIVDYIGIAPDLKKALANYTKEDQKQTGIDQEKAIAIMQKKYEIATNLLHGFEYRHFFTADGREKMAVIRDAMEHILQQEDGKKRFIQSVTILLKAFALAVPHPGAMKIKDDVGFLQAVKSALVKITETKRRNQADYDTAIKQILSRSVISDRVIDVFASVGADKPDLSILSEEFLLEVKAMPQKNLAYEMLKKLINDQIRFKKRKNIVQGRSFQDLLEKTIKRYHNRSIETAQVIEELLTLARKMREDDKRGESMGLSDEEVAFYDALADNESAIQVLGDEKLRELAVIIAETIRKNTTVDWTKRESVQAKLRVQVKRQLRKYGYPPDKAKMATDLVIEQANKIAEELTRDNRL